VETQFVSLAEGDAVKKGELLVMLEDAVARGDLGIKQAKLKAAELQVEAAVKCAEEAAIRYQTTRGLLRRGSVGEEELRSSKLSLDRYQVEVGVKKAEVELAREELRQAETILRRYHIRSPADGTIRRVVRKQGEVVRVREEILRLVPDKK
jgi:multidrug resistance efflux pump